MDFEKLLAEHEATVHHFRTRFLWLRAIEKELERRLGKYRFQINNDLIWMTLLDSRDALFIHYASWAKSIVQTGGFFGVVKAHHLTKLYVPRAKTKVKDDHTALAKLQEERRRAKFEEVFPEAAARGKMQPSDVDALKDHFYALAHPVINDRDVHRAHPYERQAKGDFKMLRLDEFEPALIAAQDLLNSLRLCALKGTSGYHDHFSLAGAQDTAIDVVDLVFFHGIQPMLQLSGANEVMKSGTGRWWWQHLEAWRERLNHAHEKLVAQDDSLAVNADAVLEAATLSETDH